MEDKLSNYILDLILKNTKYLIHKNSGLIMDALTVELFDGTQLVPHYLPTSDKEIVRDLETHLRQVYYHPTPNKTLKERYGLTNQETRVIYRKYITQIGEKVKEINQEYRDEHLRRISESEDKGDKFFKFIIDDLLNRTKFERKEIRGDVSYEITFPFPLRWDRFSRKDIHNLHYNKSYIEKGIIGFNTEAEVNFMSYTNKTYGTTTMDEFKYIRDIYIKELTDKINSSEPINESKVERFKQYIIDDLLDKSTIRNDRERFYFPSYHESLNPYTSKESYFFDEYFLPYCKTHYGITDDEVENIFVRYMDSIRDRTYRINESEDKKSRFQEYVIDHLLNKIEIEHGDWYENNYFCESCGETWVDQWDSMVDDECPSCGEINSPDESEVFEGEGHILYILDGQTLNDYWISSDEPPTAPDRIFTEYCKTKLGLKGMEINDAWSLWREKVLEKKSLNESEDKPERFLQFVLDDLKKNTTFNIKDDSIGLPFNVIVGYSYPSDYSSISPIPLSISIRTPEGFRERCINHYAIIPNEVDNLWDKYREFLMNIIQQINPTLNESEDKEAKLFNYIVDDLVKQTDLYVEEKDHDMDLVYLPFYEHKLIRKTGFVELIGLEWDRTFFSTVVNHHLNLYLENIYSIYSLKEKKHIWELYRHRINDMINDEEGYYPPPSNINESENKREKFIKTVSDDMFNKSYFERDEDNRYFVLHFPMDEEEWEYVLYSIRRIYEDLGISSILDDIEDGDVKEDLYTYMESNYGVTDMDLFEDIYNDYVAKMIEKVKLTVR
jgi:rubrerythrin